MASLKRKTVLITGASSGIGKATAMAFAHEGCRLLLCARRLDKLQDIQKDFLAAGAESVHLFSLDVQDRQAVESAIAALPVGWSEIDILINNAGTSWGAPVEEMTLAQWNKVVETNLTGTFLFSQAAGKVMIAQHHGKIINIASIAGMRGSPPELSAIGYSSSKGGVIAFTKDLAWKWGMHGIQVNAIAPGWFPSDMSQKILERHQEKILASIPLGRFGGSQDLKGAAIFLASNASDFVTGHTLVVDGGQSA
jgi:gluconate 5-dehydrogenase